MQLALVGFAAIYAPVLLVFGVDLVTEEEVATIAGTEGVARVSTTDGRSPWTVATVHGERPPVVATVAPPSRVVVTSSSVTRSTPSTSSTGA